MSELPPVIVYRVPVKFAPSDPERLWHILVSALAIFAMIVLNFVLFGIALNALVISKLGALPMAVVALLSLSGFPLLPPVLSLIHRWHIQVFLRDTPERTRRLAAIAGSERARQRLPHRFLEHHLRHCRDGRNLDRKRIEAVLRELPKRHVFVINPVLGEGESLPVATGVPFEPLSFDEPSENATYYYLASQQEAGGPTVEEATGRLAYEPVRSRWDIRLLWHIPLLIAFVVVGYAAMGLCGLPALVVVLPLAAFRIAWRFFVTRHRFLVPGGIAFREDAFWRRGQLVTLVTPDETPLIIRDADCRFIVSEKDRAREEPCGSLGPNILLAGWLSTARTPTLDEVKTFLGAEESGDPPEDRAG